MEMQRLQRFPPESENRGLESLSLTVAFQVVPRSLVRQDHFETGFAGEYSALET